MATTFPASRAAVESSAAANASANPNSARKKRIHASRSKLESLNPKGIASMMLYPGGN